MAEDQRKSNRGFAAMDDEKQREIARKGGESVPHAKRSFSQDRSLAAEAGRKGGQSVPNEKRSFSQDRELAAAAGRKGGQSVPGEKRSFARDHSLAAAAGRKGGQASHGPGRGEGEPAHPKEDTRRTAAARADAETRTEEAGFTKARTRAAAPRKGAHVTH
ncbi:general stress protein [Mongoliimonas terrestris]|uniref:general stress protein n=1 Tax=Mongoliimonas terrestris TaxID=1709001 RepID=UPI0009F8FB51|nr:KGG domain-containing protein [Mongoliimonas terrestris]